MNIARAKLAAIVCVAVATAFSAASADARVVRQEGIGHHKSPSRGARRAALSSRVVQPRPRNWRQLLCRAERPKQLQSGPRLSVACEAPSQRRATSLHHGSRSVMTHSKSALITSVLRTSFAAIATCSFMWTTSAMAAGSFDGSWDLVFVTRAGACDPTYDFTVNITNGIVTHPNLVRFRGRVAPSGSVRASVAVQDKFASGSGRLSRVSGRGTWSGYSGDSRCSGYWTAQRH